MEVGVGLRVVRGPDWRWEDQDGGEGHVGTVVEVEEMNEGVEREGRGEGPSNDARMTGAAVVQWDCGVRAHYRCGADGKFDLRVYDNAPTGVKHDGSTCDGCNEYQIKGICWKCAVCSDYYLCSACYMTDQHKMAHPFQCFKSEFEFVARVLPCAGTDKIEAKGLFPGAKVVLALGDQDGGPSETGTIVSTHNWNNNTWRSGVEVEWEKSSKRNIYRTGFEGQVDLKCVTPGSGGYYYPKQLPVLGAAVVRSGPLELSCGDCVCVKLEVDLFEVMQQGHGGWSPAMAGLRNELGIVCGILDNGNVRVRYGHKRYIINPNALVKVSIEHLQPGALVRVTDDPAEFEKMQRDWECWGKKSSKCLGQVGVVKIVLELGVFVEMKGVFYLLSPDSLSLALKETLPITLKEDHLIHDRMLTMMSQDDTEALFCAALLGELTVMKEYLEKYPNEVNTPSNKDMLVTALHCAALKNKTHAINLLLEFGANIDVQDDDGHVPLHLCAIGNCTEAAKVLLDAGADPNARNKNGQTPAHCAAGRGHVATLQVLVDDPRINLAIQNEDGDTALHVACLVRDDEAVWPCVRCLLNGGADPTLVNFNLNSTLHVAAISNSLVVAKEIIRRIPSALKLQNHEKITPLHFASCFGNVEIIDLFVHQEVCDIDALTCKGYSALHFAAGKKKLNALEFLVGFGAQLDLSDNDGNTALHFILNREIDCLPLNVPHILKVQELLHTMTDGASCDGNAVVACFLVQEGAKIDLRNSSGKTPLDVCSPETSTVVSKFSSKYRGSGTYHGILKHHEAVDSPLTVAQLSELKLCEHIETTGTCLEEGGEIPSLEGREADSGGCSPVTRHGVTQATGGSVEEATNHDGSRDREDQDVSTALKCNICDSPIMVQFQPCGHSSLCELCGRKAKQCPECKAVVEGILPIVSTS